MHTYRKTKDAELWTVGHYKIIGFESSSSEQKWQPMKDFDTEKKAAAYASYLNGGDHPGKPWPEDLA